MTPIHGINSQRSWLSQDTFSAACAALPLVSIDLFVSRPSSQGLELLLGLRNNRPAQGWWFTPGGRIHKNEALQDAKARVGQNEIGLPHHLTHRAALLGVWDHLYPDSAFDQRTSTHYVNLAYALHLSAQEAIEVKPLSSPHEQHQSWQWLPVELAKQDPTVHANVKAVLDTLMASPALQLAA
jgi:colanic acid biosynthesis protein WcaH